MSGKVKYKILLDREWLYNKYIIEKLTIKELCDIVGCSPITIYYYLIKNKIGTQNQNDGFIYKKDIIEGCLLGDGNLTSQSELGKVYFRKNNLYEDHIIYTFSQLYDSLDLNKVKYITKRKGSYSSKGIYTFRTFSKIELLSLYNEWYPLSNNRKKIVPETIDITPNTLLHWFLDDGTSLYVKSTKKKSVIIKFATMSFNIDNQLMLCDKINSIYNLKTKPYRRCKIKNWYDIYITQSHTKDFYDIIGPPPVPSLAYKWK